VDPALHLPAVDDVADQVEGLALHVPDEVEQQLGLAAAGAQVHVRDEDGAVVVHGGGHASAPAAVA
jgi:hypothetical protein